MLNPKLTDLRNALEAVMTSIGKSQEGSVSNIDAIASLRATNSELIDGLSSQLIDIALIKLANEVGNRKGPRVAIQPGRDLFGNYPGVPKMLAMGRGIKKSTLKATFKEAEQWLEEHQTKTVVNTEKNEGFRNLVNEFREYALTSDDTIEQAMRRKFDQAHD
ncbi:hypothetical protein [Rhizobium sp. WW_1]|jgi:hypothetical protein|uniref:hypothetical protein n=1 Tax=Rhizobium sp. WW_1 TaxID=1907375 RepID=UPI000648AEFB|nr:hypothetical protein [Rhizobium sp. WW_1]RKD71027.1 hypothetical protein BJ928_103551 [Rhizobium sp. WW_1]